MEDERYQKELFEFEKPKRPFPRPGKIFVKGDVAITLTMERLVFVTIGLIMFMVIIYALGVEKGKSLKKTTLPAISRQLEKVAPISAPAQVTTIQTDKTQVAQNRQVGTIPVEAKPLAPERLAPTPERSQSIQDVRAPYTIVAVTFTRKDMALAETNRLKKEGFDAFLYESDSYFLVCVGSHPSKDSAKKTLEKVRSMYRDAYIKLRYPAT